MDTQIETRPWFRLGSQLKFFLFVVFFTIISFTSQAQYFPAPRPFPVIAAKAIRTTLNATNQDKKRIKLLLELTNIYYNKPFLKAHDLDSGMAEGQFALNLSKKLKDSTGYNDAQELIALIHLKKNEIDAAETILNEVSDTTRINLLLAISYRYLVRLSDNKSKDQKAAKIFAQEALALSIKKHQKIKEISSLLQIASVDAAEGEKATEKELLQVISKYKELHYQLLHYSYYQLSQFYFEAGKYDQALYYGLQTIKSMKNTSDTLAGGDFYYWQAYIYSNIGQFQKCIDCCELARYYYKIHSGESNIFGAINIEAAALRSMKRFRESVSFLEKSTRAYPPQTDYDRAVLNLAFGECYRESKQYKLAETYYLKLYDYCEKQHILNRSIYNYLVQVYVEAGEYAKAKPYLNKELSLPLNGLPKKSLAHLYYMMFMIDSAAGDYKSAIKHLQLNKRIDDTVLTESKGKEIQKLLIAFDAEKKDHSIQIKDRDIRLLKQLSQIEKSNLAHATFQRNVVIAGILILSLMVTLLFMQYRQKRKSNIIISQKNDMLQHLLTEKEWLLKEVHHRVKNNLHTVICLLESQADYLEDDALKAIENSQHRIYAMSLIHQKLYQSEDIKTIEMASYLPEFIGYLKDSFQTSPQIHFVLEIEPVKLGVSQAIPLALIVNEAVTNSIKYAFPEKRNGVITLTLAKTKEDITLQIADNGIGINPGIEHDNSKSLGFNLMKGLSEDINGNIRFEADHGTIITIVFNTDPLNHIEKLLLDIKEKEIHI